MTIVNLEFLERLGRSLDELCEVRRIRPGEDQEFRQAWMDGALLGAFLAQTWEGEPAFTVPSPAELEARHPELSVELKEDEAVPVH